VFSAKNLRSVVHNLLSNALKYRHPTRPPRVRIACVHTDHHFVLTVQDNGLGLSEPQQARLFQLFQRLHTHVEGTGVGLYMVERIVEQAGAISGCKVKKASAPPLPSCFRPSALVC
jgi:signal transduction histidine kinase